MQKVTGRFITVEGGEGAGKSTCLATVQALLEKAGKTVVVTREPGGTALGEKIRELLLGDAGEGMAADTELLLMFAARAEHINKVIAPALQRGDWVLCDRFTDATFAYQGYGRGIDMARIAALENWVQGELRPDLTLLLDLDVAMGLQRAAGRSEPDRFEREQQAFFQAVRQGYHSLAEAHPQRYRIIQADQPLDAVQQQIRETLASWLDDA